MTRGLAAAAALYPNFQAEKKKQLARISSSALAAKRDKHGIASTASLPAAKASRTAGLSELRPTTGLSDRSTEKQTRTLAPVTGRRGSFSTDSSAMSNTNQRDDATERAKEASEVSQSYGVLLNEEDERPTRVRASRYVAIRGDLGFPSSVDRPQSLPTEVSADWASTPRPRTSSTHPLVDSTSLPEVALSARPRSRFARRDSTRWLKASQSLERIATAPILLPFATSDNDGGCADDGKSSLGVSQLAVELSSVHRRPATTSAASSVVASVVMPTAWDESDVASFFLTEVDKAAAEAEALQSQQETKRQLATAIADASYKLYGLQQLEAAVARLADAIALAEQLQSQTGGISYDALVGLLHHHAGVALKDLGRARLALAAQQRCLETALRVRDRRLQARAVKALGVLLLDAHDVKSALEHQQEALAIAIEEKDRDLEARVCANLGNLAATQTRFGHAIACHERDLALCQSPALSSAVGAARAHRNLAVVFGQLHKRELQRRHEAQARSLEDGARAFELDVAQHAHDGVSNLACQLSSRDAELVRLAAAALKSASEERRGGQRQGRRRSSASAAARDRPRGVERPAGGSDVFFADAVAACGAVETPPRRSSVTLRIDNYSPGAS